MSKSKKDIRKAIADKLQDAEHDLQQENLEHNHQSWLIGASWAFQEALKEFDE